MDNRKLRRGALTVAAASALVAGVLAAAPGASAQPSRRAIPNSAPRWLGHAVHQGKTSNQARVSLRVYLSPQGGLGAVQAAVAAVSTPGSASYGHFLTPAQYAARYAPTTAAVRSLQSWLTSQHLTVTGVEANRRYVTASGTVAAAQAAFGVSIENYHHDGQNVQAPSSAASVPDSLAGSVLAVGGLDTTQTLAKTSAVIPPPAAFVNGRPCSTYYGQILAKYQADYRTPLPKFKGQVLPYAPCGYTGPQFRAAYESNSFLDGSGVNIASVLWYNSSTIRQDVNHYAILHGDGAYAPGQFTLSLPASFNVVDGCDPSGVQQEQALDTEAMHAMAPAANIRYYAAASCFDNDLIDALARVVQENRVSIVSNSWGGHGEEVGTDTVVAYEQIFLQGALQGISFLFSSGDNGDELANTGLRQPDWPSSDPYVTAVGGTAAAIDGGGTLAWQTGWGTYKYSLSADGKSWMPAGFLYGAGGGFSSLHNRPSYQQGVVPPNAPPGRAVPDVGLDADPTTGMLIGLTELFPNGTQKYGEFRIGGTSLSSPLFAGMTALTLQHAGRPLGLLNPTIYSQARSGNFTDVKGKPQDSGNVRVDYANGVDPTGGLLYSVRTFDQDSSLRVTTGWDDVTGIGSPNLGWLTSVAPKS
jgi:subtilase family serine protease